MNKEEMYSKLSEHYGRKEFDAMHDILSSHQEHLNDLNFGFYSGLYHAGKGEMGFARYYFEKSFKDGLITPQLLYNLKEVRSYISTTELGSSPYLKDKIIENIAMVSKEMYLFIFLFILSILLFRRLKNSINNKKFIVHTIFLALLILAFNFWSSFYKIAICVSKADIHNGPSKIFSTEKQVQEGAKILINSKDGKYYYILSPQELSGWVSQENIRIL